MRSPTPPALTRDGLRTVLARHAVGWLLLFLAPIAAMRIVELLTRFGPPTDPVLFFDARAYLEAAARAADSAPLYLDMQLSGAYPASGLSLYLYPPLFAQLLAPVAAIDPLLGGGIFVLLSGLIATGVLVVLGRGRRSRMEVGVAIAALLLLPGGFVTAATANIEFALVALVGAALFYAERRPMVAGALIAGAVLWKPLLFPLALYVLAMRNRQMALGGLLTAILAIGGSLIIGGAAPWFDYLSATANLESAGRVGALFSLGDAAQQLAGSAGLPIVVAVVTLLMFALAPRRPQAARIVAVTVGIVAAPVVWNRYLLLLIPIALAIPDRRARWALAAAILLGSLEVPAIIGDPLLVRGIVSATVVALVGYAASVADRPLSPRRAA